MIAGAGGILTDAELEKAGAEIAKRRTFAIISHPDAGKTTLTEKLLLYGGAIHMAGSVKANRNGRQTTSDWMELERQRGISVTTSVMQFDYAGCRLNLLDTPGHNDFSEDTYRTLAAADTAVMLIDSVKGVEPQTIKLFRVCRMAGIPIVTVINKMDRAGLDPMDLLDEIERVLGIPCHPFNWPVGSGTSFQGVYDRMNGQMLRFARTAGGSMPVPVQVSNIHDAGFRTVLGAGPHDRLLEDLELLDGACSTWDKADFLRGQITPVFFASAMTNFGVEPFLQEFVKLAVPPKPRITSVGVLEPDAPTFSAFIFKIQANMDPRHRDRIAFARICSGRYQQDLPVKLARTNKTISLAKTFQFMAQERVQVEEAFSGDVIGLWDPGILRIGDSICEGEVFEFDGIPRFSPEHFVRVHELDPGKRKQLKKGLDQLSEEGAVQLFYDRHRLERDPVLGAVGVLQFEVTQYRLQAEYGAPVKFERLPYTQARWIEGDINLNKLDQSGYSECVLDVEGRPLVLFSTEWAMNRTLKEHPQLKFLAAVQPGRSSRAKS
jgi:peptide chain release factor 3